MKTYEYNTDNVLLVIYEKCIIETMIAQYKKWERLVDNLEAPKYSYSWLQKQSILPNEYVYNSLMCHVAINRSSVYFMLYPSRTCQKYCIGIKYGMFKSEPHGCNNIWRNPEIPEFSGSFGRYTKTYDHTYAARKAIHDSRRELEHLLKLIKEKL